MLVIKIGNKKIKLLNWIILILVFIFIIYVLGSLVFMIPIFSKTYTNKYKKENYSLNEKITFKNAWLKCNVKQIYEIDAKDKLIKDSIQQSLLNKGYKKKGITYVKKTSSFGTCKSEKTKYETVHKKDYVVFNLNGGSIKTFEYGSSYEEEYVTATINKKEVKDVQINSNLNEKKIGKYIISYTLNISDDYSEFLYRIVNVVDSQKPVINLTGEDEININYNDTYIEPGYSALDNYDGNLTNKINITNKINSKIPGTYKITYKVSDTSGNSIKKYRTVIVNEEEKKVSKQEPKIEVKNGITYINDILIVNKNYSLPKDYNPGVNKEALKKLKEMQSDAKVLGLDLTLVSGYRSYETQEKLYNKYVKKDGEEKANTYSAKPGHSEHQTGLSFDIGSVSRSFENTKEAKWIEQNAHLYGFIVRYPKDKTNITGYIYEPWHVRYLGIDTSTKIKQSNLTLEEYLGIN